ncbi:MAG TPA: acyl carrier protein [Rhizomicrobium sp.]|nr:acyl carrier protein [Rhizomicrobium sp.]
MADTNEIMARLRPLLREAFPDGDADAMGPTTTAEDVIGRDSMAHVGLMAAVEDEFKIQFEPEEITSFADLGGLMAMIARKVDGG